MWKCRKRLLVTALLLAAGACRGGLPHRWRDAALGIEVHSDFEVVYIQMMFDDDLRARMRALQRLFDVDSIADLTIFVHDQANAELDSGLSISGWHDSGQIHVMAGWQGRKLGLPSLSSTGTLLHEFVHALVRRSELSLSRWFEEGLCEVLSESMVAPGGELVWMPNGERERAARRLREGSVWLTFEQLTSYVDGYPDDQVTAEAMYAFGTSFVWSLVAADPPRDHAELAALAVQSQDVLRRRYASWQQALVRTSAGSLFRPFVLSEHAEVRSAAIRGLGSDDLDEQWWRDATRLLADPSRSVRGSMRIRLVSRPDLDEAALRRYRAWRASDNQFLQWSGLLALAQAGDLDAAVQFCRAVTESDTEWAQPLLWLILIVPAADGSRRVMPVDLLSPNNGTALHAFAQRLADDLELLRPKLMFDRNSGCYRLR